MSIILSQYPLYYVRVLFLMYAAIIISNGFIIEIMIVLYCVYINIASAIQKYYNISPFYLS